MFKKKTNEPDSKESKKAGTQGTPPKPTPPKATYATPGAHPVSPGMQLEPDKPKSGITKIRGVEGGKPTKMSPQSVILTIAAVCLVLFLMSRLTSPPTAPTKMEEKQARGAGLAKHNQQALNSMSVDQLITKAMNERNGSERIAIAQRALAIAKNRDESMQLISFGDKLVSDGKSEAAEEFYKRASTILGQSPGATSWEYKESLARLVHVYHHMQRFQEEAQVKALYQANGVMR